MYAWFHSSLYLLLLFGKMRVFFHHFYLNMYSCWLVWSCIVCMHKTAHWIELSERERKKSVKKKYWWNLCLQTETNYATTSQLHTAFYTATMTLQPVNSAILTVCVCCRYMSFEFSTLAALARNLTVIIFDNFSDKKITLDKLLQLIEY